MNIIFKQEMLAYLCSLKTSTNLSLKKHQFKLQQMVTFFYSSYKRQWRTNEIKLGAMVSYGLNV